MTPRYRRVLCLTINLLLLAPSALLAQADTAPGGVAWWKESYIRLLGEDAERRGRIVGMGDGRVTQVADGRSVEFDLAAVERIQVEGDRVGDGALKGAGVAFTLLCLRVCGQGLFSSPEGRGFVVGSLLYGSLIGAGVDAMFKGRTTVYPSSPSARPGRADSVWVQDGTVRVAASRVEYRGTLVDVTAEAVTLLVGGKPIRFELSQVDRVAIRGDRVWDGALAGALVGALQAGIFLAQMRHDPYIGGDISAGEGAGLMAYMAGFFGLVGAGADALHRGSTTIYSRSRGWAGSGLTRRPTIGFQVSF